MWREDNDIVGLLQRKFGFQSSNVANQREHWACWVENYALRLCNDLDSRDQSMTNVAASIHAKLFKNYRRWCAYLHVEPRVDQPDSTQGERLQKQIMLWLLLWGEAGNLRFVPECLCFLFHGFASKLDQLESLPDAQPNEYLVQTVRPLYQVAARMRNPQVKNADHKDTLNYDDINEFFWSTDCLKYDVHSVAKAFDEAPCPKIFKEKRSIFNPILAYFRLYFFLIVTFHVLFAVGYCANESKPASAATSSLHFYDGLFGNTPKSSMGVWNSVMITITSLLMLQVVLEFWLHGKRTFNNALRPLTMVVRLLWHGSFFVMFLLVLTEPSKPFLAQSVGDDGTYGGASKVLAMTYLVTLLILRSVEWFGHKWLSGFLWYRACHGSNDLYLGQEMAQPWSDYLRYMVIWLVLLSFKFLFCLHFMIRPLIGPTIDIYNAKTPPNSRANGMLDSSHNLAFLAALWAPVVVVYTYDIQIWFTLFQAIIGGCMGVLMKLGHVTGLPALAHALKQAPGQFARRLVTAEATSVFANGSNEAVTYAQIRYRFAIVWNEIINSFRHNDLLDDRETMMLHYQIIDTNCLYEPIFLLGGKATEATKLVCQSASKASITSDQLRDQLEKAGVLDVSRECVQLARDFATMLLGPADGEALGVIERICTARDILSIMELTKLDDFRDALVDLLAYMLDLPDDEIRSSNLSCSTFNDSYVQQLMDRVRDVMEVLASMLKTEGDKLTNCAFLKPSNGYQYQKARLQELFMLQRKDASSRQLPIVYDFDPESKNTLPCMDYAMQDLSTLMARLFFIMTLEITDCLPRCQEAQRRLGFFLNSLRMEMPNVPSIKSVPSFSVITPYYNEIVLFSLDELHQKVKVNDIFVKAERTKARDLTILKYLVTLHAEEWCNFLERVGVETMEDALLIVPTQVRLWASMRGQTLARTVHGMMLYEQAIKLLHWLEIGFDKRLGELEKRERVDHMAKLKFSYVTSCQIFSEQAASKDCRATDIKFLMKRYPNWRVSFMDKTALGDGSVRFDAVLAKVDNDQVVEVYRIELPGNPVLGEGKPENQNIALPFTHGEYVQTIDMNQEHYFEETLKMPNFLATATEDGQNVTLIGMKEHIFTGGASSLANFMTLQELVFVTLTQRVLANPFQTRMHYGHPDVFDKFFVMTNGGVSKASKGINLSEDVFSGYNIALRGGKVTHVEFMQCGKGRDVTLSQINAFEAKLSNGCAESVLSREGHRMFDHMDFFRLNSMFYSHMGFYICNAITVLCVYVYAYSKLYVSLHSDVQTSAISNTENLNDLAQVLNTQFVFQFGMLLTLPLLSTLVVEYGVLKALGRFVELHLCLGPVFYIFATGTKAHFFDVALMRGGSKYRGTGRGFAITRVAIVSFFKEYCVSHYRKAFELLVVMLIVGVLGNFTIGVDAAKNYCEQHNLDCDANPELIPQNLEQLQQFASKGQSYGLLSFAVWILVFCWLMGPFLFNTDAFDGTKTRADVRDWNHWMFWPSKSDLSNSEMLEGTSSTDSDSWSDWWLEDADLMKNLGLGARLAYIFRALRHPLAMYYVFISYFSVNQLPLLFASAGALMCMLWIGTFITKLVLGQRMNEKKILWVRGAVYALVVVGLLVAVPFSLGASLHWTGAKSFALLASFWLALQSLLEFLLIAHGFGGVNVAEWRFVQQLGFLSDFVIGLTLVIPLGLLSAFPFVRIIQTRMMYNSGFSRSLSSASELAACLCLIVGLLTGITYGFHWYLIDSLGYINETSLKLLNASYDSYLKEQFHGNDPKSSQYIKFLSEWLASASYGASVVSVGLSLLLARWIGRRMLLLTGFLMVIGGIGSLFGANYMKAQSTTLACVVLGVCLIAAGNAIASMHAMMYNFEIATTDWKGKAVGIFLLGMALGLAVEANTVKIMNGLEHDIDYFSGFWQWQFVYGAIPLGVVVLTLVFLPESPIWVLIHNESSNERAEQLLKLIRRRQNVQDEMSQMIYEMQPPTAQNETNLPFRMGLLCVLQTALALLLSNCLLIRPESTGNVEEMDSTRCTYTWMVLVGVILSLFVIDAVRRKTILKDVLPLCFVVAVVGGLLARAPNFRNLASVLLDILYLLAATSVLSVTWLSGLEMFTCRFREQLFGASLCFYYLIQVGLHAWRPSLTVAVMLFGVLCGVLAVVLFMVCASTKTGAIRLKSEKRREKQFLEVKQPSSMSIHSQIAQAAPSVRLDPNNIKNQGSLQVVLEDRENSENNLASRALMAMDSISESEPTRTRVVSHSTSCASSADADLDSLCQRYLESNNRTRSQKFLSSKRIESGSFRL